MPTTPTSIRIAGQTVAIHRVPDNAIVYVIQIELAGVSLTSESIFSPEVAGETAQKLAKLSESGDARVLRTGGKASAWIEADGTVTMWDHADTRLWHALTKSRQIG